MNNINLYRSNELKQTHKNHSQKLNFKTMKKNTICSLNDVEHFLNNLQNAFRYIKLYKLLK